MEGREEVPPPPRSHLREVMWGQTENTRQGPKKGQQRVAAARAEAEQRADSGNREPSQVRWAVAEVREARSGRGGLRGSSSRGLSRVAGEGRVWPPAAMQAAAPSLPTSRRLSSAEKLLCCFWALDGHCTDLTMTTAGDGGQLGRGDEEV